MGDVKANLYEQLLEAIDELELQLETTQVDLEIARDQIKELEFDVQTAFDDGYNSGFNDGFIDGQKRARKGEWV